MRDSTIARNYAETLLVLATRAQDLRGWGKMLTDVATAMPQNPSLRLFLESPKVSAAQKSEVVGKAFTDRMPRLMLRYIQSLIAHRRQMLIPEIAEEYRALLDATEGRVHAQVTVARETGDDEEKLIAKELSRVLGKKVIPHLTINPAILGGLVVRVGDEVMDGSVRRRLAKLRNTLVHGPR